MKERSVNRAFRDSLGGEVVYHRIESGFGGARVGFPDVLLFDGPFGILVELKSWPRKREPEQVIFAEEHYERTDYPVFLLGYREHLYWLFDNGEHWDNEDLGKAIWSGPRCDLLDVLEEMRKYYA